MARTSTNASWKHTRLLFETGSLCGLTDRQLLDLFLARHGNGDEANAEVAFEALVKRHGPMVRRLFRSLINDHHDADDAFQATFLVLARRAASIRDREAVASWLYGVAGRVAARARVEARRRRLLERVVAEQARHEAIREPEGPRELMPELYEEIARLPERYRAPIVLCYLEGQSHEEAARTLGCRLRTLQTRLQRGKAKLRLRLLGRGLAPGTGLLAVWLAGGEHPGSAAAAAMTPVNRMLRAGLSESTARASVQFVAARMDGLASSTVGLAQCVLKTLFWNRLRNAAGLVAVLAMGLPLTLYGLTAEVEETARPADTVTVRVRDDQGRPIAGAYIWTQVSLHDNVKGTGTEWPVGHGTTDGQGRYLMPVPEGWLPKLEDRRFGLVGLIWAHAPGHQMAMANAGYALATKAQSVDMILRSLADTEFLVLDPEGKPVAGAMVEPRGVKTPINLTYSSAPEYILPVLQAVTGADGRARLGALPYAAFRSVQIATTTLGVQHLWLQEPPTGRPPREIHLRSTGRIFGRIVADRPEWTRGVKISMTTTGDRDRRDTEGTAEVVSRADGLFLVPAIAAGHARFRVTVDPALPVLPRVTDVEVEGDAITRVEIRLDRTVRVRGAIRSRGTGDPVAGAEILIGTGAPKLGRRAVSNSQGRFEVNTLPGDVTMQLVSTPDSFVQVGDDPSSERHRVPAGVDAFELPPIDVVRGVTVQGRLVDTADQPIANVSVSARAASGNRQYGAAVTDGDGDFTLMIPSRVPLMYRYSFDRGGIPEGLDPVGEVRIVRENPLLLRAPNRRRTQAVEGLPQSQP
ncbi:MAG: sigma-70 family RNA polymerase sigma factor [Isosphaerales bacterium]